MTLANARTRTGAAEEAADGAAAEDLEGEGEPPLGAEEAAVVAGDAAGAAGAAAEAAAATAAAGAGAGPTSRPPPTPSI